MALEWQNGYLILKVLRIMSKVNYYLDQVAACKSSDDLLPIRHLKADFDGSRVRLIRLGRKLRLHQLELLELIFTHFLAL